MRPIASILNDEETLRGGEVGGLGHFEVLGGASRCWSVLFGYIDKLLNIVVSRALTVHVKRDYEGHVGRKLTFFFSRNFAKLSTCIALTQGTYDILAFLFVFNIAEGRYKSPARSNVWSTHSRGRLLSDFPFRIGYRATYSFGPDGVRFFRVFFLNKISRVSSMPKAMTRSSSLTSLCASLY